MSEHIVQWVRYCASEVDRQEAGALQVGDMFNALDHARMCYTLRNPRDPEAETMLGLTFNEVIIVACLVESTRGLNPIRNGNNWRSSVVTRGHLGPVIGAEPEHIARQMELWWQEIVDLLTHKLDDYNAQVDTLIKHLLDIHPWRDGNGRTASILRNWLLGKLDHPEPLPYYYTTPCNECQGKSQVYIVGMEETADCEVCDGNSYIDKR